MASNCVRDEIVIRVIRSRAGRRCLLENKLHPASSHSQPVIIQMRYSGRMSIISRARALLCAAGNFLNERIRLPRSDWCGRERCVSGLPPQFPRQYADAEERRTVFCIREKAVLASRMPFPGFLVRIKGRTCTQKVPSGK